VIYYVDIDETICFHNDSDTSKAREYSKAKPHLARIELINALFGLGHEVVYWTARGSVTGIDWYDLTKRQLDEWGAKHTDLKMGKPHFDIFIDDKAFNSDAYFGS